MSELKAETIVPQGTTITLQMYPKGEADKVIEEKDEIIDELKEHIDELQKATDSAWSKVNAIYDELRHQKYKRCLAMADYCESQYHYYITLGNGFWLVHGDKMTRDTYHKRGEKFLTRWNKIWLALAEEPAWARFLQLIHKEVK